MKLKKLIEELEDYAEMLPDAEVLICSQPDRYPLEYGIRAVSEGQSSNVSGDVVYIIEGAQKGYGPRDFAR